MPVQKNNLLLTKDSKEEFKQMIIRTAEAIADSLCDTKAYAGLSPEDLKKAVHVENLLPDNGEGFDNVLDALKRQILPNFLRTSSTDYMAHLHSPALLESIAAELIIAAFNQSMDSWDQAPVATEVELEVIQKLCSLYGYDEKSDGVFTSGGSQSNISALLFARDWYCKNKLGYDVKKHGLPENYRKLRIYTSEISHFSMEKGAHLLGLGYDAVVKVPVDDKQKMDACALEKLIGQDLENGNLPFCVVATIGTTDYGSIDPMSEISSVCQKYGLWLHADAAYGSAVILSSKYAQRVAGFNLCDSITVDFHKMFLLPISCSAVLLKDASNFEALELHADYLNREEDEEDGYTNLVGKSLQTTRRFDALKVWVSFKMRGKDGWGEIIDTCMENAAYLYSRLRNDAEFETVTEPEISSVVFRIASTDDTNKRVRRALIHKHGVVIGQTVYNGKVFLKFTLLNPLVTHEKLDSLLELIKSIAKD
ncbi:MAG: aspartate aminotransferase family protein [Spirochaetales bacterium]|nr:aspartate aminotransferase family protein [Spirochaetales bacterium]